MKNPIKFIKYLFRKIMPYNMQMLFLHIRLFPAGIPVWFNYMKHRNEQFENELSAVLMLKNEAPYMKEWIEYHKLVGVEKFYIYDNESSDNLKEVLRPYIDNGMVVYFYVVTTGIFKPQLKIFNDAIKKFRNKSKWMAFLDADEFIVPVKEAKITDVLNQMRHKTKNKVFPALAIHWVVFGYCGHRTKPEGLVIDNYTKNDGIHELVKPIVDPRTVIKFVNTHWAVHFFGLSAINENGKKIRGPLNKHATANDIKEIRVNHYMTRSYEEHIAKLIRNKQGNPLQIAYQSIPDFDPDYLSHHEDMVIHKYLSALKTIYTD
jgi:hypothetical protein